MASGSETGYIYVCGQKINLNLIGNGQYKNFMINTCEFKISKNNNGVVSIQGLNGHSFAIPKHSN